MKELTILPNVLDKPIATPPKPILSRVLIEPLSPDEKIGNLFVPGNAAPEMNKGRVLSLGSGRRIDGSIQPFEVAVGDVVMFKLGAAQVTIQGVQYFLVQEDDIIAIL